MLWLILGENPEDVEESAVPQVIYMACWRSHHRFAQAHGQTSLHQDKVGDDQLAGLTKLPEHAAAFLLFL